MGNLDPGHSRCCPVAKAVAALLFLGAVGCGGSEPTTTLVTGNLPGGAAFSATHAVYGHETSGETLVLVSDDPNACQHLDTFFFFGDQSHVFNPDSGVLSPALMVSLAKPRAFGTPAWTVGDNLVATVDPGTDGLRAKPGFLGGCWEVLPDGGNARSPDGGDAPCPGLLDATSGVAHLDRNDDPTSQDARASGDLTLGLPDGGELEGTFVATPCGDLQSARFNAGCAAGGPELSLLALLAVASSRRRRKV